MDEKKPKQLYQYQLSQLKNSTKDNVIKDRQLSEGFRNNVVKGVTDKVDNGIQVVGKTSDVMEKIAQHRALRQAGKKVMGILPFAGAMYGLASGDPAMAAEEVAGDVPILGQAYEAIKPTDTGNVEEERQMIAERDARAAYDQSPAHLARLKALQKIGR